MLYDATVKEIAMLTDEQSKALVETVERAFAPLTCVAEVWADGDKFRFRVLDAEGNPLVSAPSIPLQEIADRRSLSDLLCVARSRVESQGFKLAPLPDG